jgi:transcriptional regulator GlxA family with amidase domain
MSQSEACPELAGQEVRGEAAAFAGSEIGRYVLRIAFDRIDISILVTLPAVRDVSGTGDLLTVTQEYRTGGEAVHVHIASALLYDQLDKRQGRTNSGKVLIVDPRLVRDPAIERLARAFVVEDEVTKGLDALYVDAVCLALVTRLLGLRCDLQLPTASRQPAALPTWRLKRVIAFVDVHLADRITLADLAGAAGQTRMHFAAQFRVATGVRPHEYVLRRRIERAQDLLRNSNRALVDVALGVGFQTQAHFTTVFKRFAGQTPHRWRQAAI